MPCSSTRIGGLVSRRAWGGPSLLVVAASTLHAPLAVWSKYVEGEVTLTDSEGGSRAIVVTKFCFDYNAACRDDFSCPADEGGGPPGLAHVEVHVERAAAPGVVQPTGSLGDPVPLHVALLDDEYFSFPEVSGVWDSLRCEDVMKAAKKTFPVSSARAGWSTIETRVIEKIRPRWWYLAFVDCASGSGQGLKVSYKIHMLNMLKGWEQEFSMDAQGVYITAMSFCALFGMLAFAKGSETRAVVRQAEWQDHHPALLMLRASVLAAWFGYACWVVSFASVQASGAAWPAAQLLGQGLLCVSKSLLSLLLLLLAGGQCICTADIAWSQDVQLVVAVSLYGFTTFVLEVLGDDAFQNTSTEFVYDTRPGLVLVTLDVFWLWLFVTRALRTYQLETRARPRNFFRQLAAPLALW
eukprot:TRINITY_DN3510_c0_g2_i1.p1 TRINITY_DN3510_c0_g2~~TRINITY_DN3510_c0_g2_i1.p1  ORF type:complete len:410 (+),score=81.37 TRINITY_DN3510_c0_g2_i1:155-1384(+)